MEHRYDGERHEGPDRSSPYPLSRLAPPFDLVDTARVIQEADRMLATVVGAKLEVIAGQIRELQAQARGLLEAAKRDQELHRARCAFHKRPGATYHLYRLVTGETYFSMLSPEDWGKAAPHEFLGSYRLETDMSWTPR